MTEDEIEHRALMTSVTTLWSSVVESDAALSEARQEASAALQLAGCARPLIDDVNLIFTELTVNALTHGGARQVSVDVGLDAAGRLIILNLTHDETGGDFDGAEPPVMAASNEISGRGRAIVAALSDRFETKRTAPNQTEHVVVVSAADSATRPGPSAVVPM